VRGQAAALAKMIRLGAQRHADREMGTRMPLSARFTQRTRQSCRCAVPPANVPR